MSTSVEVAAESRPRSRSPRRGTSSDAAIAAPGRRTSPALQTHSEVDFSSWMLVAKGRNSFGNLMWNLKSPEFRGTSFNLHEFPSDTHAGDPWSPIVWEMKAETFEGGPADKAKMTIEISDEQEASLLRLDEALINVIEKQSMEVLNQKTPVKRELIAGQHYKSPLLPRTETRAPRVQLKFVVRATDRKHLGTLNLYKLKSDGETYEDMPIVARGWDEIQPLIEGHNLRGGKMRATVVSCWTINILRKEVYPMLEIKEMWVREPKGLSTNHYSGLTEEQQAAIRNMP